MKKDAISTRRVQKHLLLALALENLLHDLLFLNKEGPDDLLPDSLVAQDSSVCSVHSLLSLGQTSLLLVTESRNYFRI